MSRFKKGDKVRWQYGGEQPVGTITDGPVYYAALELPQYVVLFADDARLLGERVLEPAKPPEKWVDCPGEHRFSTSGVSGTWVPLPDTQVQRKVEE